MSNGRFMARHKLQGRLVVFRNPKQHSCFVNWKDHLIKLNGGYFSNNPIQQLNPCLKAEATMLLFPIVFIFGNNCLVSYFYQDVSRLELEFSAHFQLGKNRFKCQSQLTQNIFDLRQRNLFYKRAIYLLFNTTMLPKQICQFQNATGTKSQKYFGTKSQNISPRRCQ